MFIPIADYIRDYGDVRENGLGHRAGEDERGLNLLTLFGLLFARI